MHEDALRGETLERLSLYPPFACKRNFKPCRFVRKLAQDSEDLSQSVLTARLCDSGRYGRRGLTPRHRSSTAFFHR